MNRKCIALLVMAVLLLSSVNGFAEENVNTKKINLTTIEKSYSFKAANENNLSYNVPKTTTVDGKKYKLENVWYKTEQSKDKKLRITKKVKLKNKKDLKKTVTKIVNGEKITLKANVKNIEWKEIKPNANNYTKEFGSENDILKSLVINGQTYNLVGHKKINKTKEVSAPATFTAPSLNCNKYNFNGKVVYIKGNNPTWDGYENDIKEYLGLSGSSYKVKEAYWDGEAQKDGDRYIRTAIFRCNRVTPTYSANYISNSDEDTIYEATVTYEDESVNAVAVATYKRSIWKIIFLAGAGLAVIAAAIASIFYYLSKRRKEDEEDNI